jgi:hypothetical protein
MEDQPTTLWTLAQNDERVSCQVRLVPYGIEVDIVARGRVMLTRTFETDTEALAWAASKREAREAKGWTEPPGDE